MRHVECMRDIMWKHDVDPAWNRYATIWNEAKRLTEHYALRINNGEILNKGVRPAFVAGYHAGRSRSASHQGSRDRAGSRDRSPDAYRKNSSMIFDDSHPHRQLFDELVDIVIRHEEEDIEGLPYFLIRFQAVVNACSQPPPEHLLLRIFAVNMRKVACMNDIINVET